MTKKIRAAVVGYGNIGKAVVQAIGVADDFELAGVVRRSTANQPLELTGVQVVDSISKLKDVDVAILCAPTRQCPDYAKEAMASASAPSIASIFIRASMRCMPTSMPWQRRITSLPSFPLDGTLEPIPSSVLSWRQWLRKA